MTDNEITSGIIGAAIRVHRALGPGLLESVYERLLVHELRKAGFAVLRQVGLPIEYEGIEIEVGYRADLIVEGRVIVELKSVECVLPVHRKQALTYMRLANMRLGLLLNFNQRLLKDGITRLINS